MVVKKKTKLTFPFPKAKTSYPPSIRLFPILLCMIKVTCLFHLSVPSEWQQVYSLIFICCWCLYLLATPGTNLTCLSVLQILCHINFPFHTKKWHWWHSTPKPDCCKAMIYHYLFINWLQLRFQPSLQYITIPCMCNKVLQMERYVGFPNHPWQANNIIIDNLVICLTLPKIFSHFQRHQAPQCSNILVIHHQLVLVLFLSWRQEYIPRFLKLLLLSSHFLSCLLFHLVRQQLANGTL